VNWPIVQLHLQEDGHLIRQYVNLVLSYRRGLAVWAAVVFGQTTSTRFFYGNITVESILFDEDSRLGTITNLLLWDMQASLIAR
jgi:hypothetical protein